jgi:TolB-like protein
MRIGTEQRRLVAIMFTDMVGYSALTQRNEELALALLEEHDKLIRRILPNHQGREIKTTGDGFLVDFASALAAVQCAIEIQQAFAHGNSGLPPERHLNIRIGIHLGDVVRRQGDDIGDGVNVAARLEPLAEPGGICISRAVFEQVQGRITTAMTSIGEVELKNLTRPVEVFRVELQSTRADQVQPNAEDRVGNVNPSEHPMLATTSQRSIAVLPFVNMSRDQENEFLGDGITEDLIMALSRVKGLRVPARTSSFAFKGKNEDIRRIGQLLNVEMLLEGSVRKSGNKLRITAQLVKTRDSFHLWSERYDREMKDVFDIQDDITRSIVSELQVQLRSRPQTQLVRRQTASTAAYELCVKGRIYWNQRDAGLRKALHYFELALLEDQDYALAWTGLADAYAMLGFYDFMPCREALAKARTAAEKAVTLDDHSAEAHCSLGMVVGFYDWDLPRATTELERALQLNPNYSVARCWYAAQLAGEGRDAEALEQARLAVEGDPLSVFANVHLGWTRIILRRFDEALPPLQRCLELDPNTAAGRWQLGQACWFTEQRETALAELQRAVDLSGRSPMMLASLGWALALSGQNVRAREIQRELAERATPAPTRPLFLAVLHAGLGENDLAFAALERALAERELWLSLLGAVVELSTLASDPRWTEFIRKVEAGIRARSSAPPASGSDA